MFSLALQMNTNDPAFWVMVMVMVAFVVIAVTMVVIAVVISRVVHTISSLEKRVEPLMERIGALTEQVKLIAAQGREVAEQVNQMSGHLSTATMHFSESMSLVKEEVRDLKQIIGISAEVARDKVEMISRSIDRTHYQMTTTTAFIHARIVEPAREIAAIMAGVRRGLEVLVAPTPKPINQTYGEDEMFIG